MLVLHTHAYTQSAYTYTQNVYSVRLFEARIRKSVQAKEIVMHQEQNARNLYVVYGKDGFSVCETVRVREREKRVWEAIPVDRNRSSVEDEVNAGNGEVRRETRRRLRVTRGGFYKKAKERKIQTQRVFE